MSQTFLEKGRRSLGYTIDQTILVVAVIAILITLIIASVGWDLITRTSGTKLAGYFQQIERANGTFYGRHGAWMDTAFAGDDATYAGINLPEEDNVLILQENLFTGLDTNKYQNNHQNLLPGFESDGITLLHGFGGATGTIRQYRVDLNAVDVSNSITPATPSFYWVIEMDNIPYAEALNADESIDGAEGFDVGRLTVSPAGSLCDQGIGANGVAVAGVNVNTTVCYVANSIN